MHICITTVYNSENCGSYWQARTLGEYLRSLGNDVVYLKRSKQGTSHGIKLVGLRLFQALKTCKPSSIKSVIRQYKIFEECEKEFGTINKITDEIDINVLGSDTIWNLSSNYFLKHFRVFWGGDFLAKKTISYAASIANTNEKIITTCNIDKYLNQLDSISVRDDYSRDILKRHTNKEIRIVCDPTMLFDKEYYYGIVPNNKNEKIIFVYYFGKISIELQKTIHKYAKQQNKRIVVMGDSMKGDITYAAFSPHRFMECFVNADFIVTNTFHGTIFSINLEKQALFNSDGKKKVEDLLTRFGLGDHDYSKNKDEEILFSNIEYSSVSSLIEDFRHQSRQYIREAIQQ